MTTEQIIEQVKKHKFQRGNTFSTKAKPNHPTSFMIFALEQKIMMECHAVRRCGYNILSHSMLSGAQWRSMSRK